MVRCHLSPPVPAVDFNHFDRTFDWSGLLAIPAAEFDNFFLAAPSALPALVNTSEATLTASPTPFNRCQQPPPQPLSPQPQLPHRPTRHKHLNHHYPTHPTQTAIISSSEAYIDGFYAMPSGLTLDWKRDQPLIWPHINVLISTKWNF
jgi:hypothetical protein